jgi:hypothetical protein
MIRRASLQNNLGGVREASRSGDFQIAVLWVGGL